MASPIRLSEEFIEKVEQASEKSMRSLPKQVEYWAQLGEVLERYLNRQDLEALFSGRIEIHISPKTVSAPDMDQVFDELESDRRNNVLNTKVIPAKSWIEISREKPGFLLRVNADGSRELGSIIKGKFEPLKTNSAGRKSKARRSS